MPSTPTTKSQVQAYRFVLRRMQSALVRKDAVMLHDPMRTHSRATVVGVCIAALGLLGFLIWGILSPKPKAPNEDGIVIGKPSGQVYVLVAEPDKKLIPVFNLASARLLLHAQSQQGEDNEQAAPQPAAANAEVVEPSVIDDNELRDIPKGRKVGIADGPDLLPSADQRVEPYWSVCDQYQLDEGLNNPAKENLVKTTVMAGVTNLGDQLQPNQSLLVQTTTAAAARQGNIDADLQPGDQGYDARGAEAYLVYRTPSSASLPTTSAVRARLNLDNLAVLTALDLTESPRVISTGMLNAIEEKEALTPPNIPERGESSGLDLGDPELELNGSVFSVDRSDGLQHYVVVPGGIEPVKKTTADLTRYRDNPGAPTIKVVSPDVVASIDQRDIVDDSTFPEESTEVLPADTFPVACFGWHVEGTGDSQREFTSVHIGEKLPEVELDSTGQPKTVAISTPSADGIRIDAFYMPPGRGAVVRQTTSEADFNTGQITLVSDRGVKYGVPDPATAGVLGLDNPRPAPIDIIKLLPDGASLSAEDVEQSYDSTPFGPGEYPTETPEAQGGG
jgi:type VII secretion protein EccB